MRHRTRRGLDLPIAGAPRQEIEPGPAIHRVALLGRDGVGLRPELAVEVGDRVRLGQLLFVDRATPGVRYTAPGAGRVAEVHRGAKRRFESLVIELDGAGEETFAVRAHERDGVREALLASGLWASLRTRPFGRVPAPTSVPHSIFVAALDTRPLAADPLRVLAGRGDELAAGLRALAQLTDGAVHLCQRPGPALPGAEVERVQVHELAGPHPAGLPGTHIHLIDPVSERKTVWYLHYQQVLAIGRLMLTGRLASECVVAVGGPAVERPALLRTRPGASLDDLLRWLRPRGDRFALGGPLASVLRRRRRELALTTAANGEPRPLVPLGRWERVLPLELLPAPLFRALAVGNSERARELGCLELEEEDLALCAFVCASKQDFAGPLRAVLDVLEREG